MKKSLKKCLESTSQDLQIFMSYFVKPNIGLCLKNIGLYLKNIGLYFIKVGLCF
jgi:hypothetical protein